MKNIHKILGIIVTGVIATTLVSGATVNIAVLFFINGHDLMTGEKITIDIGKPIVIYLNIVNKGSEDLVLEEVYIRIEKSYIPIYSEDYTDEEIEEKLSEYGYTVDLVLRSGDGITFESRIENPKEEMLKHVDESTIDFIKGSWRISLTIFFQDKIEWSHTFDIDVIDSSV